MTELHQPTLSQKPISIPSSASGPHPGITQMWNLLNNKDSQSLQIGMRCLSRQAKIFRMFPQTVAGTLCALMKNASVAPKSRLRELFEHDQLRTAIGPAISLLFKQPRSLGINIDSIIFELVNDGKLGNDICISIKQLTQLAQYPDCNRSGYSTAHQYP
ncbi:hypothetical protein CPB86DRAFT_192049 [Serendipita vermifera]|nr:hypothetical protein CPB86DRAFT_192049 [Serendipita vermifera]